MLKLFGLDKVQINVPIQSGSMLTLLISCHIDTAALYGVSSKLFESAIGFGRYLKLDLACGPLAIGVYRRYGKRWLMYRFNGAIDFAAADKATMAFGPFGFLDAMMTGRVKALEFSLDVSGLKTEQYLHHVVGVKSSFVCNNAEMTGSSFYVGSRRSSLQFVMYDKAQELRDKKKPCTFKDLLRIELRVQNRTNPLPHVVAELIDEGVFDRLRVVSVKEALCLPTKIKDWPLFVSTCQMYGVPRALLAFQHHKKTFLKYLQDLSLPHLQPHLSLFRNSLVKVLPWVPFIDMLDGVKE